MGGDEDIKGGGRGFENIWTPKKGALKKLGGGGGGSKNLYRTEQICLFGVLYKDSTSTISK